MSTGWTKTEGGPNEAQIAAATVWIHQRIADDVRLNFMIRSFVSMFRHEDAGTRERIEGMLVAIATYSMLEGIAASEGGELPDLDHLKGH